MNPALTTELIEERYKDNYYDEYFEIEGMTCSVSCVKCDKRVWFDEIRPENTPPEFDCPYCGFNQCSEVFMISYDEYMKTLEGGRRRNEIMDL